MRGSVERREPIQREAGTETRGPRPKGKARSRAAQRGTDTMTGARINEARLGGGKGSWAVRAREGVTRQSRSGHGAYEARQLGQGQGPSRTALDPRRRSVRGRLVGSASDQWFLGPIRCENEARQERPRPRHSRLKPGRPIGLFAASELERAHGESPRERRSAWRTAVRHEHDREVAQNGPQATGSIMWPAGSEGRSGESSG